MKSHMIIDIGRKYLVSYPDPHHSCGWNTSPPTTRVGSDVFHPQLRCGSGYETSKCLPRWQVGRGHADGKVECQPGEHDMSLPPSCRRSQHLRECMSTTFGTIGEKLAVSAAETLHQTPGTNFPFSIKEFKMFMQESM